MPEINNKKKLITKKPFTNHLAGKPFADVDLSLVVHDNSKNYGLSFSRNFAINRLNTRYIASIDADVELDPKWLEILYEDMQKNQNNI